MSSRHPFHARISHRIPARSLRQHGLLVVVMCVTACATSPLGRDQLILFPDDQVAQMGITAYQQLKGSTPVSRDAALNQYVSCVAESLTGALPDGSAAQDWEVSVFAEDQINAFALPGGKIGVYRGLLSVAENQDQLATVIAHEIAHVLSRHSNERISTQYATSTGLELASVLAGQSTPAKQTLLGLLGVGGPGRRAAAVQQDAGERSRPGRAGINGPGRVRSPPKRGSVGEHERGEQRRRAAGIPLDPSVRREPHPSAAGVHAEGSAARRGGAGTWPPARLPLTPLPCSHLYKPCKNYMPSA
jgi:hypothetical protein